MKKYNRVNLKFFLVGIIVPLILFAFVCGGVYAWFTASTKEQIVNMNVGTVSITFDGNLEKEIVSSSSNSKLNYILPGSQISLSGAVKNNGTGKVYAIIMIVVEGVKADNTTAVISKKYYTATGVELVAGSNGSYTLGATEIDADKTSAFTNTVAFGFFDYDDSWQGATVNITVTARAIQFQNIDKGSYSSPAINATNLLMAGF